MATTERKHLPHAVLRLNTEGIEVLKLSPDLLEFRIPFDHVGVIPKNVLGEDMVNHAKNMGWSETEFALLEQAVRETIEKIGVILFLQKRMVQ